MSPGLAFLHMLLDLAHNEMAILGSIAGLAAPVTGTVGGVDIGNFLARNRS